MTIVVVGSSVNTWNSSILFLIKKFHNDINKWIIKKKKKKKKKNKKKENKIKREKRNY